MPSHMIRSFSTVSELFMFHIGVLMWLDSGHGGQQRATDSDETDGLDDSEFPRSQGVSTANDSLQSSSLLITSRRVWG
jgi:hypothetical protein